MHNICGDVRGEEYTRYPAITTNMLGDFIKHKVDSILEEQGVDAKHQVYCFPLVLGDRRNGIKYACMCISMSGIAEEEETLYDKLKPFNFRPKINKGVMNAIVRAYEFSDEKLRAFMDSPKNLRGLALRVKDIEELYKHRRIQVQNFHGTPFYTFYADMDRILDEFLFNPDDENASAPNYTVLSIKALGKDPDSPLSYDIMVSESGDKAVDNAAEVFKELVTRNV